MYLDLFLQTTVYKNYGASVFANKYCALYRTRVFSADKMHNMCSMVYNHMEPSLAWRGGSSYASTGRHIQAQPNSYHMAMYAYSYSGRPLMAKGD